MKKVKQKTKQRQFLQNRAKKNEKIPQSKHAIIKHIFDFQDIYLKYPREGFPDVLDFSLEALINAIREEPRLLYDEQFVLDFNPNLVNKGHSFIKEIINRLQLVFLEVLEPGAPSDSVRRARQAQGWLQKIFDAAKHGVTGRLVFPGGKPRRSKDAIKQEYKALCTGLTNFFLPEFKDYVQVKKKSIKLNFDDKNFKEVLKYYHFKNKSDFSFSVIDKILKMGEKKTNTVKKLARAILSIKYNLSPNTIKNIT